MFVKFGHFCPSLMFKVGAKGEVVNGVPLGYAAHPTNVRLGRNRLTVSNTLAYFDT